MLEEIPSFNFQSRTYRYALAQEDVQKELHDRQFDSEQVREMLEVLRDRAVLEPPNQYLDRPFQPRHSGNYGSGRFSDGAFPVFYSAVEFDTATAEAIENQIRYAVSNSSRLANFVLISCAFSGQTKDLRPLLPDMPFLVADDHSECQRIGTEAHLDGLASLLTPSAQQENGTCLPVLLRAALSDAREERHVVFRWNPETQSIELRT